MKIKKKLVRWRHVFFPTATFPTVSLEIPEPERAPEAKLWTRASTAYVFQPSSVLAIRLSGVRLMPFFMKVQLGYFLNKPVRIEKWKKNLSFISGLIMVIAPHFLGF